MGSRQYKRRALRSQVRLFGTDVHGQHFSRLAETVDVSRTGVRLSGIFVVLQVGSEVEIQTDTGSARLLVVWQGEVGTERAGEVGLRLVDRKAILWPDNEPGWVDTFNVAVSPTEERRYYRRFACDLAASVP